MDSMKVGVRVASNGRNALDDLDGVVDAVDDELRLVHIEGRGWAPAGWVMPARS